MSLEKSKKFEHIFEDEECVSIWKYDLNKFPHGPISVEHKWKASYLKELETVNGIKLKVIIIDYINILYTVNVKFTESELDGKNY